MGKDPTKVKGDVAFDDWLKSDKWIDVESSNLTQIKYDFKAKTLYVRFSSGKYYMYLNVPTRTVKDLFSASSMGRFHARRIKGVYSFSGPH